MDKYVMIIEDGKITIQEADYVEDGWYIEIEDAIISLFEIPLYGGDEQKIGEYTTILDAITDGKALT